MAATHKTSPCDVHSLSGGMAEMFASFPALPFHDGSDAETVRLSHAEPASAPRTRRLDADAVLRLVASMRATRNLPH